MEVRLRLDGVVKRYGARTALPEVTIEAASGQTLAIVGPNGSGKSTLLKIVAGLLRPTRGRVALAWSGEDRSDPAQRRRLVGYAAPDLTFYPELTGIENLSFFASVRGAAIPQGAVAARLAAVGLEGRGDDPVATYSSGMRQRLRLALAMLFDPPVLLLDEPGLALDEAGTALIPALVDAQRHAGGLTLLATNDAREAALGERAIALGA